MGLKSGSRDAGFDDDEPEDEQGDEQPTETGSATPETDPSQTAEPSASEGDSDTATEGVETEAAESGPDRPVMSSIPYKLRRDRVNEGREQVPYFLREEVIEAEPDLQDTLEEMLGEDVYKSDYREAAMVVAQRNPELVAEVLREWGYDLEGM